MTWTRIHNQDGRNTCPYCLDTGWVELNGDRVVHGFHYSRGSTACKFCDIGLKRWTRMRDVRQAVTDDYTVSDVVMPEIYEPASKAYAKEAIRQIQETWKHPKAELDKTETRRDVEARILKAREALEEKPIPEPAQDEPFAPTTPDDIPF